MPRNSISFSSYNDNYDFSIDLIGREWIFEKINEWLGTNDVPNIFLLLGEFGSGKTTIAMWLAGISRGDLKNSNPKLSRLSDNFLSAVYFAKSPIDPYEFIENIAIQLAKRHNSFKKSLIGILGMQGSQVSLAAKNGKIAIDKSLSMSAAFSQYIIKPLQFVVHEYDTMPVILIDGIEEFSNTGPTNFLEIFSSMIRELPSEVRFILTSRPFKDIETHFPETLQFRTDVVNEDNLNEIKNFLKTKLAKDQYLQDLIKRGELDEEFFIDSLIKVSRGDFNYIKKVLYDISSGKLDPREVLKKNIDIKNDEGKSPEDHEKEERLRRIRIDNFALTDTWSKVDLLGFSDYADAIVDLIRNDRTERPLIIGIDAEWGMGKTTLMHMIEEKLSGKQEANQPTRKKMPFISFPTVWFNAWKFDHEESLWSALALEVLSQIKQRYNYSQRIYLWFRLAFKRLSPFYAITTIAIFLFLPLFIFASLSWLIVTGLSNGSQIIQSLPVLGSFASAPNWWIGQILLITGAIIVAAIPVATIIRDPFRVSIERFFDKPSYADKIGFIANFEKDFGNIVSIITETPKNTSRKKLVIFIDDLDRCTPPKPVDIIEAINTILDADNCVFVIGMDAQMVCYSIEAKYKDLTSCMKEYSEAQELSLGQRFLEKIIQIDFRIPKASPSVVAGFIEETLKLKETRQVKKPEPSRNDIDNAKQKVILEYEKNRNSGGTLDEAWQTIMTSQQVSEDVLRIARKELFTEFLFEEVPEVKLAISEAPRYLEYNPRKIKRFINNFRLQALIANRRDLLENNVIRLDTLAKCVVLSSRWPGVFEILIKDKNFIIKLNSVRDMQERLRKGEGSKEELESNRILLESHLRDPYLKKLIDSDDFISLMQTISSECLSLEDYYSLAQTSR